MLKHTPPLLQVICVYEGSDPHNAYDFKVKLSSDENGPSFNGGWTHQVRIPQQGTATNQFRVMWEFAGFPRDSQEIFFRLNYRNKETAQEGSLDFKIPGVSRLKVRKMGSQ